MINKLAKQSGLVGSLVGGLLLLAVGVVDVSEPPICQAEKNEKTSAAYIAQPVSNCHDNIEGDAIDYLASGAGIFLVMGGFASLGRKEDEGD